MLFNAPQTFQAPAKLNLFLHITGRRDDGYHNLQTIFRLINYYDEITFRPRNDQQIKISYQIDKITSENDLILKSARLLLENALQRKLLSQDAAYGVDIDLKKNIPMGGGLGGGSSDAASTLMALNQLWGLNLSLIELIFIGRKIGADVPIFIYGENAWAEGIGDNLNAIDLAPAWYVIINPKVHVSTQLLFQSEQLNRSCVEVSWDDYQQGRVSNVFQDIVFDLYPQVKQAYEWLSEFSQGKMTGTGASIFAEFETEQQCKNVLSQLPSQFDGFYAQGK